MSVIKIGALQDLNGNTEFDLTNNIVTATTVNSTTINNSGNIVTSTINSGTPSRMTLTAAQASTTGTSIDFTGIPSWVKKITVMFNGVSTSGTSACQIQLGTSSGFETTGYTSTAFSYNSNSQTTSTAGFAIDQGTSAATLRSGLSTIVLQAANIWIVNSNLLAYTNNNVTPSVGIKSLSGTLDRVRITTINGTDQFDAGSISILYEG